MSKIEAVIFDCDGIVVDSDGLQRQAEQHTVPLFAEKHSLTYDAEAIDWGSMQGWARRKIAANVFGISTDSDEADQFRQAVVDTTVEIASLENLSHIEHIASFTDYLRMRGLPLGLATSSNRAIFSRYCEVLDMDIFPLGYTAAQGECLDDKPKPGPFIEIMRRMNARPERTLIIEDSESGITSGRYAGAVVLAVATTKPIEYLHTKTDAQIVSQHFHEATHLLQPLLP